MGTVNTLKSRQPVGRAAFSRSEDAVLNPIWQGKSERCYYNVNSASKTVEPVFPTGELTLRCLLEKPGASISGVGGLALEVLGFVY